jgi:hypothetical protein
MGVTLMSELTLAPSLRLEIAIVVLVSWAQNPHPVRQFSRLAICVPGAGS